MVTTQLPSHLRQLLHPDFLVNEQDYLRLRAGLLATHRGQWVAVLDGAVVAAGHNLLDVLERGAAGGGHPYLAKVGEEEAVLFRYRRVEATYDASYLPFPLPRVSLTFCNDAETHAQSYPDVIADTGADTTALPVDDCRAFDLFSSPYLTGVAGGVLGAASPAVFFRGKAEINGRRVSVLIQPLGPGAERLAGRDLLNQHRVIFDGPAGKVIFEP